MNKLIGISLASTCIIPLHVFVATVRCCSAVSRPVSAVSGNYNNTTMHASKATQPEQRGIWIGADTGEAHDVVVMLCRRLAPSPSARCCTPRSPSHGTSNVTRRGQHTHSLCCWPSASSFCKTQSRCLNSGGSAKERMFVRQKRTFHVFKIAW